jgi:hypothetical protein
MKDQLKPAEFKALEKRYGAGFSQYLADQIARVELREINFLDIKELNDLVAEYRVRIRELIAFYRATQKTCRKDSPLMRRVYADHETILIRRQISDLRKLYRMAWSDSHELMNAYLHQLKTRSPYQMARTTKQGKAA